MAKKPETKAATAKTSAPKVNPFEGMKSIVLLADDGAGKKGSIARRPAAEADALIAAGKARAARIDDFQIANKAA